MNDLTLRPARFDRAGRDQLIDAHDLRAGVAGMRQWQQWTHESLALRPGESAVDIGSGTGSEVFRFADAVGADGAAVGVEPDPNLLAAAQQRATELGSPATFHTGDAYGLPFGADTFDAVLCERVFQHLTAPARAAAEIARVLKPGGRALVADADWATAIVHPGEPKVVRAVIDTLISATTNPLSGRRIPGLLTEAGLAVTEIGSSALVQDRTIGAGTLVTRVSAMAVARGVITEDEARQLREDLDRAAETGEILLSVTMFGVIAHAR